MIYSFKCIRTRFGFVILGVFIIFAVLFVQNILMKSASKVNPSYEISNGKLILSDGLKKNEIILSAQEEGITINFVPHDFKELPNDQELWVTASIPMGKVIEINKTLEKSSQKHVHLTMATDQIFVIQTKTNAIVKMIPIGENLKLADIAITPDKKFAYLAAESGNAIYKINISTNKVVTFVQLPPDSKPHKIGISQNGKEVTAKDSLNKNIYAISIKNDEIIKAKDNQR